MFGYAALSRGGDVIQKKLSMDERKLAILRGAKTAATNRYSFGGRLKRRNAPKPVTLPKVKLADDRP